MSTLSTSLGRGIAVVLAALGLFTVIGVLTAVFYDNHWDWRIFGFIVGLAVGLVVGLVVHVAIPVKIQLLVVGASAGLTADFVTGFIAKVEQPSTLISVAAVWISDAIVAINEGLKNTGLPTLEKPPLAVGLWAFLLGFGAVLLFGALNKDQNGAKT